MKFAIRIVARTAISFLVTDKGNSGKFGLILGIEKADTWEEAAVKVLERQTGILRRSCHFAQIAKVPRRWVLSVSKGATTIFCQTDLPDPQWIVSVRGRAKQGHRLREVTLAELDASDDFNPLHAMVLRSNAGNLRRSGVL